MSFIQSLLRAVLPKTTFARMETESRSWILTCPKCGHKQSIWDMGGIRAGASGNPRRYTKCPQCGESNWKALTKN
jgi:DNA-directed RNA polymerase subunit M/transcription elongation factor TFIIS